MLRTFLFLTACFLVLSVTLVGNSYLPAASAENEPKTEIDSSAPREQRREGAQEADREAAKQVVVAKVNGSEVTLDALLRAMNQIARKYARGTDPMAAQWAAQIKSEALERVIFEELAVQEAKRQGINPANEEINKAIQQSKERAGSDDAFREYLHELGMDEEGYRAQIERRHRYERIIDQEIFAKAKVEEKHLKKEYKKVKHQYVTPEKLFVDDVFFIMKGDEKRVRARAEEVLKVVRTKEDKDVYDQVLDGTFIVRRLEVKAHRHPAIYQAAKKMDVGELSHVIKDQDGFHIVKVAIKNPAEQQPYEKVRGLLEQQFKSAAVEEIRNEWHKALKKKADIEILFDAAENNLGERGGDSDKGSDS